MTVALLERPKDKTFDYFHVNKERSYPIRRNGKVFDVYEGHSGLRVKRRVQGAATASTPQSQASQAQAALQSFLAIAPTKHYAILGTLATASAGGGAANVTWQEQIPIIPAFCTSVDYEITLTVTPTITSGTAQWSEFAPYCAINQQFTLGGAPPWPFTELTAWHIDETMHRQGWDPAYSGLGGQGVASNANPALASVLDYGISGSVTAFGANPGSAVTTGVAKTFQFTVRQQFQRKRHLLWGAIPFGDPENRPNNIVQLNALVGNNPEANLIQNTGGTTTAVTSAQMTVKAIYNLSYIDLLPPSVAQPPAPAVGYGLQLTPSSPGGLSSGNIFKMTHRTAQVYTAMHHILVNQNGMPAPIQADYFGLWDDQDQQSARWSYDNSVNTFQEYFTDWHRIYNKYPYLGVYSAELDDGVFPAVPSVTPYRGLMSPDASYAQAFDLPVTPAMTTAIRIPAATTSVTPYVRNYEFGLVRVPY
jgi:hypothetical protein